MKERRTNVKNNIITKILAMIAIITILAGDCILPIKLVSMAKDFDEELDNSIRATTKSTIEERKQNNTYKTKNNLYEIRKIETQILSGAIKDENNNLVWNATSNNKGHEFTFRVNYELSGYREIPEGCFKITIPKQILRNRDGLLDDYYIMGLPTLAECKEEGKMAELVYKEDGDYLVIYNPNPVDSGLNGYFEISYGTNSLTYNYKDYDPSNTGLVKNGGTASDEFYTILELNVEKDTQNSEKEILNNISEDKNIFINTNVKLQSTQKRYPSLYRDWDYSWMEEVPADSNEYYYLIWEINSYIEGGTQKYNFTLSDFVTNLTEGATQEDYQLVGYKLAGERYFSNKNTANNQATSGYRYDYVLTKHKIATFRGTTYKLKNDVIATVHPIDGVDSDTTASSSNTFSWDPSFVPPTGSFDLYKYGNNNWNEKFGYSWRYANYNLDKLQSAEVNELKGFKYFTETIGYAYPWTIGDNGNVNSPADYGVNNVNYDTYDDTLYLEDNENPINTSDYYLDYFTYSISNKDAEYDDFYNKLNQISPIYADDEAITFYAKFGDRQQEAGKTWVQIGTYNLKTKQIDVTNENVQSITTTQVRFKEGAHATGWRFTTSNKHYYTNISVTPYYVLTNSDFVMENIANKSSIKIKNTVNTEITDHKGNEIFNKEISAFDYARVTYYDSDISKTVASVANKKARKQYIITWKVNVWEKATSGEGQAEYTDQDSGTFYDIIPLGGEIDVNTIQVETEKGFLNENEYSYEVVTNYKNSGRTMLVLNIDKQANYYNVYYNTAHSWESMKDYGRNVLNPVAFETGNEKITKGHPDDGGDLSSDNKQLFNNLDETTDDKKFLYAERSYNINALTATISGLQKKVKSLKDDDFKYETEVNSDENYTYRFRFENTYTNSAKNLVFFDSLENFNIIEDSGAEKTSGWHGTLTGIDLIQLKQKGIDAKVYVSTIDNLALEQNHDLENTSVWNLLTDQADLSQVKAIAIDMTKKINGEEFILNAGDSVTANIYLKSPEYPTQEIVQNQYAYNNIYMQNTLIDELENTEDYFIHQDYTSVKYKVVADVPIQKVSSQNMEKGVKGITFRLYGTSSFGNEVDSYITTGNNGLATFKGIEAGSYILQEYSGNKDWVEDHTEHIVKINLDRTVLVDGNSISKENILKIANTPRAHTNVTIYKKDLIYKTKVLEGAKFKLYGTSDYGNEILVYSVSDNKGKVVFEDIEKGKYKLEEVSTIDGYTLNEYNKETFKVIVDENSNYNVEKVVNEPNNEYESTYVNGRYEVYNEPLHEFYFMKKDLIDINKGVSGITFKITGTSDYGNYFEKTSTSDETGKVTFDGIEKGTYTLWETETKDDYVLNTDTYTVKIEKTGEFTITENHGENEEDKHIAKIDGKYNIYNEPKHSFYFIKKDSYNNEKLGGAKFKLYGTSNNGTIYDEEVTSVEGTGIVEFTNLESGTYFLKEIKTPDTDELTFVQDENEKIIEITEKGKVTLNNELIWPLEERTGNEAYTWFNTRNKGQITVAKKWVDDLTDEQRQEPKIYISTVRGEEAYSKVYFRTADENNSIIDYVRNENETVTAFKRNINLTEAEVKAKLGVTRLDNNYADSNVKYKIYAWIENDTLNWWTKADRAVLPANLDYYFKDEEGLTNISWTGIYRSGYWTGDIGEEEISETITNMKEMFYGCTSMENLDISFFNNSSLEESTKANMEYAFGNNGSTANGSMSALRYITFGNNFKLFDTSILPKGKWKKQGTEEQTKNTDLIGTIDEGTYEWKKESGIPIGTRVNYSTMLNEVELNDWSVLYNEDGYTYIILDNYMSNTAIPEFNGKKTYSTYSLYTSSNRRQLIDGLSDKLLWKDLVNNGKVNGIDLDQEIKEDTTNVWAMGSPTLEMWVDSWNTMYPNNKLFTAKKSEMSDDIGWGIYVGSKENPTTTTISLSSKQGYNNKLYYPNQITISDCQGYWLVSPSASSASNVMYIGCNGRVEYSNYGIAYYAVRPIIRLPSSILK